MSIRILDMDRYNFFASASERKAAGQVQTYLRTDMYFLYVYRLIVRYDSEPRSQYLSDSEISHRFNFVCTTILNNELNVLVDIDYESDEYDWDVHYRSYSQEVDVLRGSFVNFLLRNKQLGRNMGVNFDISNKVDSSIDLAFQKLMLAGYLEAKDRIEENGGLGGLFNACMIDGNTPELIIYATPHAMKELTAINKLDQSTKFHLFKTELESLGFDVNIANESVDDGSGHSVSVMYQNLQFHSYINSEGYMNKFMKKRINRPPVYSLYHECQVNLKRG